MKEKSSGLKSNLKKIDSHILGEADYKDIPELPENFFTDGQLLLDGQPVKRRRGKQKAPVKKQLTVRLNSDVVDFFKDQGRGWQAKINKALVDYVKAHKHT